MTTEEKQAWFSKLAGEFQKSHLVSNVFIGLTLTALEKIIDVEYVCPCDPALNAYAYAFFVVPSILAFVLMMNIQRCRSLKAIFFSCVPVIEWLFLVFMEGNYFVCARTTWYGEYVSIPEPASLKWCEPVNKNSSGQLLIQSQQCFYESQVFGLAIITAFTFIYLLVSIVCCAMEKCKGGHGSKQEPNQDAGPSDPCLPTNNEESGV